MTARMSARDLDRWQRHREHCEARKHDAPCWGPDGCLRCIEIGNSPPLSGGSLKPPKDGNE